VFYFDKQKSAIEMDVAQLGLVPGKRYRVRWNATSTLPITLVIKLPGKDNGTIIANVNKKGSSHRVALTHASDPKKGTLTIVLTEEVIAKNAVISFQDFAIVKIE
jgi:hypothetical protein